MIGDLEQENSNHDTPSSSQAWQKDAVLDESTRTLVQEHLIFLEVSKSMRRLVASGNSDTKGKGKP